MLIKPSALAKTWAVHTKTVTSWIKQGRLPAVRTLGHHFRIRSEDIYDFAKKEGLHLPLNMVNDVPSVYILGKSLRLKQSPKLRFDAFHYETVHLGLLAFAERAPQLVIFDAGLHDPVVFIQTLKQARVTSSCLVCVYDLVHRAKSQECLDAGADLALTRLELVKLRPGIKHLLKSYLK